jgi:hypothetical protein
MYKGSGLDSIRPRPGRHSVDGQSRLTDRKCVVVHQLQRTEDRAQTRPPQTQPARCPSAVGGRAGGRRSSPGSNGSTDRLNSDEDKAPLPGAGTDSFAWADGRLEPPEKRHPGDALCLLLRSGHCRTHVRKTRNPIKELEFWQETRAAEPTLARRKRPREKTPSSRQLPGRRRRPVRGEEPTYLRYQRLLTHLLAGEECCAFVTRFVCDNSVFHN